MRPISSSPTKGNPGTVLTREPSTAPTNAATTSFAATTTVPRGRENVANMCTIENPRVRGRSQSPVKGPKFDLPQQPLHRDLFYKSPRPKSPSKGVINSDFTGRTFSEREWAVELKAKGRAIPPLPSRTLDEVLSKKAQSKSREDLLLDEVEAKVKLGSESVSTKESTFIEEPPTLGARDKATLPPTQSSLGPDSDSSTSSVDSVNIPRYEMIIWRTFPARNSHKVLGQTRKCSFPITKKLARKLLKGQETDSLTAFNQFISTQGTGIPVTSDPSFTLRVTVQSDGTPFPPEYLDVAEQQFAHIIDEIVSYQVQGYGRWAIDGMMRRVVTPEAGQLASLGPCLETLIVITLEACGNRWIGLPGFDANGNLKSIPRSEVYEVKKAGDAGTPHHGQYLPPSNTRFTSGPATTLKSTKNEDATISTPAIFQRWPTANATKGIDTTSLKPFKRSIPTTSVGQHSSSPDLADGEGETADEDMSMVSIENLQTVLEMEQSAKKFSKTSHTIGSKQAGATLGLTETGTRLSTSTTPFLAPTPARHQIHATSMFGSVLRMPANYAGEASITPTSKLPYYSRANPSPRAPLCDDPWGFDDADIDVAIKAKRGQMETPGLFEGDPTRCIPLKASASQAQNFEFATDEETVAIRPGVRGPGFVETTVRREPSATLGLASKSGAVQPYLKLSGDGLQQRAKKIPATKSLQNLAQAVGETAVVRRRWEESTTASLSKERPPSPIKSRANSPVKRTDGLVKSGIVTGAIRASNTKPFRRAQPTIGSVARTTSNTSLETQAGMRSKSRAEGGPSQAGNRVMRRVESGGTGLGRGN